jgi:hypothetical protein
MNPKNASWANVASALKYCNNSFTLAIVLLSVGLINNGSVSFLTSILISFFEPWFIISVAEIRG